MIYPPTIVVRHSSEKTKKCSMTPLRYRKDMRFCRFPLKFRPDVTNYVRLGIGGELLSPKDCHKGLLILDASWKHVKAMEQEFAEVPVRSIPSWKTAFPRKSKNDFDPDGGLATIEALYAALIALGRPVDGILDDYYWKDDFLELNQWLIKSDTKKIRD